MQLSANRPDFGRMEASPTTVKGSDGALGATTDAGTRTDTCEELHVLRVKTMGWKTRVDDVTAEKVKINS